MNDFNFQTSASQSDLLASVNENQGAKYIAGGTNLIDLLKYNLLTVD